MGTVQRWLLHRTQGGACNIIYIYKTAGGRNFPGWGGVGFIPGHSIAHHQAYAGSQRVPTALRVLQNSSPV